MTGRFGALRGYSLEATMPQGPEIAALAPAVLSGTEVYLSAPPHRPDLARVDAAISLARLGLVPVPHIAARNVTDREELLRFIERLTQEAQVDRLLIIGGDLERPRGPFADSASIVESVPLREMGIREIGIAGYPEGHPSIPPSDLAAILDAKLVAARSQGLSVHVATQFCFNADSVVDWVTDFRLRHPDVPVKIGIAGPTGMRALLKFAMRCGVKAPMEGLGRKLAAARKLVGGYTPADLLNRIDAGLTQGISPATTSGPVGAHFFSFGGLLRTATWADGLGMGPAR